MLSPEDDIWFTTSDGLIAALGPIGQEYAKPKDATHKADLSYADPMLVALDSKKGFEAAKQARMKAELAQKEGRHSQNVKDIFIEYLLHVDPILKFQARHHDRTLVNPPLDEALLGVFNKDVMRWLQRRGWDITDFLNWAWILSADNAERAATRLVRLSHRAFTKLGGGRVIPQFVFLFLLRRQNLSAQALRPLLFYAWDLLGQSESAMISEVPQELPMGLSIPQEHNRMFRVIMDPKDDPRGMRETIFMIMIIRLLRSARKAWPAACETITSMLCQYLNGLNFRRGVSPSSKLDSEDIARLTYMYNTILTLLAIPASLHPFQSATHQQKAQFSLLRRMNQFEPPLIVDRRGYQAVTRMQLMHKKTLKEREWAHMKAKSWPPWKEEKLGLDADIGVEHGISRAKEAMIRAREAGYAVDIWEDAAGISSGWDTDGSPTIQTRLIASNFSNKPDSSLDRRNAMTDRKNGVWAARVRATRTLDEAWSCFLAYKDQMTVRKGTVYHAMFEKLVHDAKRPLIEYKDQKCGSAAEIALPGDGKEVLAAPESPREAIYVRTPPPSIDDFWHMMVSDGLRPSGRLLAFLLMNAPSFEAGMRYLEGSAMTREQISAMFDHDAHKIPDSQTALESIPKYLFAAFIRFLTLFSPTLTNKHGYDPSALINTGLVLEQHRDDIAWSHVALLKVKSHHSRDPGTSQSSYSTLLNPLSRAFRLLLVRKPRYRPSWYHLLQALARPKAVTDVLTRFVDQDYQDIKTWGLTCRLLDQMLEIDLPLDLDGFLILCTGLEKAIFASERLKRRARTPARGRHLVDAENGGYHPDRILSQGLPLIKEIFKNTVRSSSMQQDIPASVEEEKSEIDEAIESEDKDGAKDAIGSQKNTDDTESQLSAEEKAFLPPACLLPKLLAIPSPAQLHAFIRILGLRRDYDGLLDLIEWMSLNADDIRVTADEAMNGRRMMRRSLTATRVFLERSWMNSDTEEVGWDTRAGEDEIKGEPDPAPMEIIRVVHDTIIENSHWGGWPTDEEVLDYCMKGRFL